jgi:predicted TIM-barrel fold metal-dependent hydrolase
MHPPLARRPADADGYRWPWYEGRAEYVGMAADLVPYRSALRELAAQLGCDADEPALIREIARREPAAFIAECVREAGIAGLVVDDGYPPPAQSLPVAELAAAAAVPVARLVRIELVAERLLPEAESAGDLLERFAAALRAELDGGAAGLKSIIAYRSGLGVAPPAPAEVAAAFAAAGRGRPARLDAKPLLDALLLRALDVAREREVPLQLHAGYGDRDIDLRGGDPFEFRWVLESGAADGVPIVFLHAAYPFVHHGALLAAVHERVYLDIATCVPPLGHAALLECWRAALAIAPITRIHASSDAAGLIEQALVAARRARRTLGIALDECIAAGELEPGEARAAAALILGGNARELYLGG